MWIQSADREHSMFMMARCGPEACEIFHKVTGYSGPAFLFLLFLSDTPTRFPVDISPETRLIRRPKGPSPSRSYRPRPGPKPECDG